MKNIVETLKMFIILHFLIVKCRVFSASIGLLPFQIPKTLSRLESVANFTEFVKAFSVFGAEMVELAHVTCKLN